MAFHTSPLSVDLYSVPPEKLPLTANTRFGAVSTNAYKMPESTCVQVDPLFEERCTFPLTLEKMVAAPDMPMDDEDPPVRIGDPVPAPKEDHFRSPKTGTHPSSSAYKSPLYRTATLNVFSPLMSVHEAPWSEDR
jgi:hypothetical protein